MQQEVYADLLFLINFSMDFLCLFLTARILHRRLHPLSAVSAAAVGGIYSVASLFINASVVLEFAADVLVCAIICIIGFTSLKQKPRQYFSIICVYVMCASALGGIMTALFNLLNKLDIPINSGGDNISSWLFLLLAAISGFAALRGANFLRRLPSGKTADVEILFCGQKLMLHGMTDTGNMLRDPIGGKAVIVTDIRYTLPLLPDAIRQAVISEKIQHLHALPPSYSGRIRLIPSKSVSGECLLIGLIPDKIIIHNSKGATDVAAIFAPAKLHGLPGDCAAIIPGELNT